MLTLLFVTQGITFEKLDEMYETGVKPRHFKRVAMADAMEESNNADVEKKMAKVEVENADAHVSNS